MSLLWVQHQTTVKTFGPTKVSIQDCDDVDDFLKEIKKESQLNILPNTSITLFQLDGKTEIDVGVSPSLFVIGNSRTTPLIVKTNCFAGYQSQLFKVEQEINELENSEEYKTLAKKNRAWAVDEPTEQEKGEWELLEEKLDELKKKEDFHQKIILSMNAHSLKKSEKIRYSKETAIKDERRLLSDIAGKAWEKFQFKCEFDDFPTFRDLKRASGFKDDDDVRDYFRMKARGQVKEDEIKECFTETEWIWLILLNYRVNPPLHDKLVENRDGSLRLMLEHDVYKDGARLAEYVIRTLYGPEKKFIIKDASIDSK